LEFKIFKRRKKGERGGRRKRFTKKIRHDQIFFSNTEKKKKVKFALRNKNIEKEISKFKSTERQ